MSAAQGVIQLGVRLGVERVDVAAQRATEQERVLGDDTDARAQVMEADLADVDAVDDDAAGMQLGHAEERHHDTTLAGTGTADDTDLLVGGDAEGEALEHVGQLRAVFHVHVVELDGASRGPVGRRLLLDDLLRRLLLKLIGVVEDTLGADHVVLDLGELAHQPGERLLDSHHRRETKTRLGAADLVVEDDDESDGKREQRAEDVEAETEPTLI